MYSSISSLNSSEFAVFFHIDGMDKCIHIWKMVSTGLKPAVVPVCKLASCYMCYRPPTVQERRGNGPIPLFQPWRKTG